ncbi:MAG: M28 family peptidase [Bacteroidota bacterium]
MKKILASLAFLLCLTSFSFAQEEEVFPEFNIEQSEIEFHLRFLASDEMLGRRTGEQGNEVAARYIAECLRSYGATTPPGHDSYFQDVPLKTVKTAKEGSITWGEQTFTHGEDLIVLSGLPFEGEAQAVYAGHGLIDEEAGINDYEGINAEGKIVFVISGTPGKFDRRKTFRSMAEKRRIAADQGAVALVEIYKLPFPWDFFKRYFGRSRMQLDQEATKSAGEMLPYFWVSEGESGLLEAFRAKKPKLKMAVSSTGTSEEKIISRNVIGVLEGSDPELKDEFIILTAHFDHVGHGTKGGTITEEDSIFNGARDNGIGTAAMLAAAKAFSKKRPRRSVAFIGFTAEEVGLLGSQWYADNPIIPLNKTMCNLNSDGGGYTVTDRVVIYGYDRVNLNVDYDAAAAKFGLTVSHDPAPEQNLFERSDNASFAKKGVPAPTLSPGFTAFDKEYMTYYHQVVDNPESLDFPYLVKVCQTFTHIARLLADADTVPTWVEGDRYEEVGKELYGSDK